MQVTITFITYAEGLVFYIFSQAYSQTYTTLELIIALILLVIWTLWTDIDNFNSPFYRSASN